MPSKTPCSKPSTRVRRPGAPAFTVVNNVAASITNTPKVNEQGKVYTIAKVGNPFDRFDQTCRNCHTQSKEML